MKVSEDSGGHEVHLVGWCLGGLLSILTAAAFPELPIKSVAMVASPFDTSKSPMACAGPGDRQGHRRTDPGHHL